MFRCGRPFYVATLLSLLTAWAFSLAYGSGPAVGVSVDLGVQNSDRKGHSSHEETEATAKPAPFVATEEWTEIKPGQSIPRGLHVRINLQTGVKEAKLMEAADSATENDQPASRSQPAASDGSSALTVSATAEQPELEEPSEPQSPSSFRYAELERALKDIATSGDEPGASRERKRLAIDEAYMDSIKQKYRSIDTIKEQFEAANLNVKIDAEIINDLLKEFRDAAVSKARLLTILEDLEYYLHQIDNAVYFSHVGGIAELLDLMNKSLDNHISSMSMDNITLLPALAQVLGAAWHSNPKVQVISYKQGATLLLLRILTSLQAPHSSGSAADVGAQAAAATESILSSTLYALAGLLRRFPAAQQSFVDHGGLGTLMSILKRSEHASSTGKLEVKVVALIDDLLTEEQDNSVKLTTGRLPISLKLIDAGWCDNVVKLLSSVSDHRHREKVLLAIKSSLICCREHFDAQTLVASLQRLSREYEELVTEESRSGENEDSYYSNLLDVVRSVTLELTSSVVAGDVLSHVNPKKEEL